MPLYLCHCIYATEAPLLFVLLHYPSYHSLLSYSVFLLLLYQFKIRLENAIYQIYISTIPKLRIDQIVQEVPAGLLDEHIHLVVKTKGISICPSLEPFRTVC